VLHVVAVPYFAARARGVLGAAEELGHSIMLASSGWSSWGEAEHGQRFSQLRARGVILAGSRVTDRNGAKVLSGEIARYVSNGGSVVAIGQRIAGVESILIPNVSAGEQLGQELLRSGYRRLLVLSGPPRVRTSADRLRGLRAAIRGTEATIEACEVSFNRRGGHEGIRRMLGTLGRFDCVVAVSDDMAIGAIAELRESGVSVPGGIGVAGIGDVDLLQDFSPRLTTVHLGLDQVGAHALRICVGGPQAVTTTERRVPCYVVQGDSTRASDI